MLSNSESYANGVGFAIHCQQGGGFVELNWRIYFRSTVLLFGLSSIEVACAKGSDPDTEGSTNGLLGGTSHGPDSPGANESLTGWTTFPVAPDALVIYVSSSSGSDLNSGLSPSAPKRTIAAGYALLRNGYPDQLKLKRGDSFDESLNLHPPYFSQWQKSGRSNSEKMLVTSYGSGSSDPILWCPSDSTDPNNEQEACLTLWNRQHLAFVGLQFIAATRMPGHPNFDWTARAVTGVEISYSCDDILLEGNRMQYFELNTMIQDRGESNGPQHIKLFRNQFLDSYNRVQAIHSQGVYLAGASHIEILENAFIHNGWNETVNRVPTIFNHNIYVTERTDDLAIRGNIFAQASSMGIKLRSHVYPRAISHLQISGNLFLENPIAISVAGEGNSLGAPLFSDILVEENVITNGGRVLPNGTNWGIDLAGVENGIVRNNYLVQNPFGPNQMTIKVSGSTTSNLSLIGNRVFDFGFLDFVILPTSGVVSYGNLIDGITDNLVFRDPNRTLANYAGSLGLGWLNQGFLDAVRAQSYATGWRSNLTAFQANQYIKPGFQPD